MATDINRSALEMARVNVRAAGVDVGLVECQGLKAVDGSWDLVMLNPPYIADEKSRTYRDGGGHHGAQLSLELTRAAISRVNTGGVVMLYTGSAIVRGQDWLRGALETLAPVASLEYAELDPDVFSEELEKPPYHDVDRIAVIGAVLTRHPA